MTTPSFFEDETTQRLKTIPRVGNLTVARALAVIGNPERFRQGNALCAYVGLVPLEHSSGGKIHHGHLSRRGDRLFRKLMVGAGMRLIRSVLAKNSALPDGKLKQWILARLKTSSSKLKVAVACAAKLLKIMLALLKSGESFQIGKAAVSCLSVG